MEEENKSLKNEIQELKEKIKLLEYDKNFILQRQNIIIKEYKNLIQGKWFNNHKENEEIDRIFTERNQTDLEKIAVIQNQYEIIKYEKLNKPFVLTNDSFLDDSIDERQEKLQDITCSICLNVLNQPITQCSNCEELFCKFCIDKHIQNRNNCPKCRDLPFKKQKLGRKLKDFLNYLKFSCPLKCGETFGLADSENHKDSCEKLKDIYQCNLCKKKFDFNPDLKLLHIYQCEKLIIACIYCNEVMSVLAYKNHLKMCDEWMEYCEDCNLMVCRKYEEAHKSLFCHRIRQLSLSIEKLERSWSF